MEDAWVINSISVVFGRTKRSFKAIAGRVDGDHIREETKRYSLDKHEPDR